MLITPITPKVMASPMAASSSTEPSEMPYQAFCTASQTASRFLMAPISSARRDRRGNVGRQAGQETKGVLVTALADPVDGGELVVFAAFIAREDDRGARFGQRALHASILLLRQRRFDGRQRVGLPRFEYGLRGLKAHARIAGKER